MFLKSTGIMMASSEGNRAQSRMTEGPDGSWPLTAEGAWKQVRIRPPGIPGFHPDPFDGADEGGRIKN